MRPGPFAACPWALSLACADGGKTGTVRPSPEDDASVTTEARPRVDGGTGGDTSGRGAPDAAAAVSVDTGAGAANGGGPETDGGTPAADTGRDALASGTATLSWEAPKTTADGKPMPDIAGYRVHFGSTSQKYSKKVEVGKVLTYQLRDLPPATYYFAVTAYASSQAESGFSNEASKTISAVTP